MGSRPKRGRKRENQNLAGDNIRRRPVYSDDDENSDKLESSTRSFPIPEQPPPSPSPPQIHLHHVQSWPPPPPHRPDLMHKSQIQLNHMQSWPPSSVIPNTYVTDDPSINSHWRPTSSVHSSFPIHTSGNVPEISTPIHNFGGPLINWQQGLSPAAMASYQVFYDDSPTSVQRHGKGLVGTPVAKTSIPPRKEGLVGTPVTKTSIPRKESTEIDVEKPYNHPSHQTESHSYAQSSSAQRRSPIIIKCGSRFEHLALCVPLYQAALRGDWDLAKSIFDMHPTAFLYGITVGEETVLHIAAAAKHVEFVQNLVDLMKKEDLTLQNKYGYTALCFAAASGVVKIAEIMVKKNSELPTIPAGQKVPLHLAALLGHRPMSSYLYNVTKFEQLERQEQVELFSATISTGIYDIALSIMDKYPYLAIARNRNKETALHILAGKPSDFSWGSHLGVKEKVLKRCLKWVYNKTVMKTLAHQLVTKIWQEVLQLQENEITDLINEPSKLLFDAVIQGNVEFLVMLVGSYPDLMSSFNSQKHSLFHTAIRFRQEHILKLIHEIGAIKDLMVCITDKENNNMLHFAGKLAPANRLTIVSGAALQMQRELLWFKEVEKIVPPSFTKAKNIEGKTPHDLFTKEHQELRRDGEKWMKETATSCMLVATLIATVVFAAAFTVPGGMNSDTGVPVLLNEKLFTAFAISDAVAMLTSTTSVLMFLSILTSRYAEEDFLFSLPGKLTLGLTTLFASIGSMVLAFTAAFFMLYHGKGKIVPIFVAALAGVPVTVFIVLYYKLWAEVLRSTFWSKALFRHSKRRLF